MERDNIRKISLSGLAVSVSAAAMLGYSGVASADLGWYCLEQYPCHTRFTDDQEHYWGWDGVCYYGGYPPGEGTLDCFCGAWAQHIPGDPSESNFYPVTSHYLPECYGE